jgi:hypothetical protein
LRAVTSPPVESAQAKTRLQRVVEKRSGDRPLAAAVSGVTARNHIFYAFIGQAQFSSEAAVQGRDTGRVPLSTSYGLSTIEDKHQSMPPHILLRNSRGEVLRKFQVAGATAAHSSQERSGSLIRKPDRIPGQQHCVVQAETLLSALRTYMAKKARFPSKPFNS